MLARIDDNHFIHLEQVTVSIEQILDRWFRAREPSSRYSNIEHWDGWYRRYNSKRQRLALPFLDELKNCCKISKIPLEIVDNRSDPKYPAPSKDEIGKDYLDGVVLEDYQVRALHACCDKEIGLVSLVTGAGKCLGKDTPVMMFDGTIKLVQDVKVGDLLLGDDSTPRRVLSLCTGREPLYRVKQKYGDDYIVNESHILSLKRTRKWSGDKSAEKIVDVSVRDYLGASKYYRHIRKGYKVPVDLGNEKVPFDPYFLGLWLGDGISSDLQISVGEKDDEIVSYLQSLCDEIDLELVKYPDEREKSDIYALRLYKGIHRPAWSLWAHENHLKKHFKRLELFNNKHIPNVFKWSSRDNRLRLLAGFIDSDGEVRHNCATIVHRPGKIIEDMIFVARSLGFRVTTSSTRKRCTTTGFVGEYVRVGISGHTDTIPTKLKRKVMASRKIKKDPLVYGIEIESIGVGTYYGFEIDGNKRFLLGDFTVTHNTEVLCGLVKMFKCPSMIIVDQIIILEQIVKRLSLRGVVKQEDVGMFCYGHLPDSDSLVMVGSIQSLSTPSKITRNSVSISKTKAIEMYRQWVKTDHTQLEHVPNVIKNISNIRDIDDPLLKLLISHCEDVEWNRLQNWYKTRKKKAAVIQKLVGKCELLLCDECDTCVTQQHAKLFKSHYSGRRKYGVTGTPYDKDKPVRNLFLKEHLGNVICEASREEVQAAGRIIPIKHYSIVVGADGNRNDCRVYDIAMREEMIENEKFHNTVCKVVSAYKDEKTLILLGTSPIEPLGRTLEGMITDSKFVFGKTSKKDRRKYIELFEKGELKCLIGSLVFKRGLDLSGGVDNLIIIGGGAKYSEYNQRIGRAIRLNEKGHARVFGFFFLNNKHLYKHSRANLKAVVEMGYPTWVIYGGKTIDGEKFINSRYRLPRL